MQQKAGGPMQRVKPFTPEVRAEIDDDLTDRSIAFMRQQTAAGKPFFLYLPFSMGHFPNLPSKQFAGKSRIGNYGDKMMEGDYHVGQVLDALKELKVDDNTIVVFASDNGPSGWIARELGNLGTPDMGHAGPYRGELGEATEGSLRTCCIIRWPGHVQPDTTSYAMFSIMDFLPTFAAILGGKLPTDRPYDGVDQSAVLLGKSEAGARDTLLTFNGPDLVAVRWKQRRSRDQDRRQAAGQPVGRGLLQRAAAAVRRDMAIAHTGHPDFLRQVRYASSLRRVVEGDSANRNLHSPPANHPNCSEPCCVGSSVTVVARCRASRS